MSLNGRLGISGIISGGTTGPPSSGGFTSYVGICGIAGGPVNGSTTFTLGALIGGSGVSTINVNNGVETEGVNFEIDYGTGTITRPFPWQDGDGDPSQADVLAFNFISGV